MKLELHDNLAVILGMLVVGGVICFLGWQISSCNQSKSSEVQACVHACISKDKSPYACRKACTDKPDDTAHPPAVNQCIRNCIDETKKPVECKQACTVTLKAESSP